MRVNFSKLIFIHMLMGIAIIVITIMAAGVFIDSFTRIASAQTNEDSTEVLRQVEKYQSVWNTHDEAELALFFTEDADFIMGNLPLINGRDGIQNWWQIYFNRQEPERQLTITINSLRIIAPEVALINIETTTGGKDNQGEDLTTRKARGTWMMHRQNGNWLIIAMRGMPTEEDKIIRRIEKPEMEVDGTFVPAGPPVETPVRNDVGTGCIVEVKQMYNITGTLTGKLEIDFRILVYGPCGETPGTYKEEWIAFGSFNGTVDGSKRSAKFTYTADVKAGGDVDGKMIFGEGIDGELIVKGNFKERKLSYDGIISESAVKD